MKSSNFLKNNLSSNALLFLLVFNLVYLIHGFGELYQAHGYNEIDHFVTNIRKGVSSFKIDIAVMYEESCRKFSTGYNTSLCENLDDVPMCCLGLIGDIGPVPYANKPFNTTINFIKTLNDETFLGHLKNLGEDLLIQLDTGRW